AHGPALLEGACLSAQAAPHPPDELGVGLGRDAPRLLLPRLELVFRSTRRTVWYEIASTTSRSPGRSARTRGAPRASPAGGALQESATRRASCSPLSLRA